MATARKHFCRICTNPAVESIEAHLIQIICDRCGEFSLSDSCAAILGDPHLDSSLLNTEDKKASVGYWLRQAQREGGNPILRCEVVETLATSPWFPSLHDQRQNIIRLLGERAGAPGERVNLHNFSDQFILGCRKMSAVNALIAHLETEGSVEIIRSSGFGGDVQQFELALTFNGWLEFEDIDSGKSSGHTAFLAMPFGKSDLDDVWLPGLRTAVRDTGFTLQRVDDEPKPGLIDVRMRIQIKAARFLIVELAHQNLGAYWEAGFAEGLGKPVIYTRLEGHSAHFDVDHSLRIDWNPANIDVALARLKATIRNALPDAKPEPS